MGGWWGPWGGKRAASGPCPVQGRSGIDFGAIVFAVTPRITQVQQAHDFVRALFACTTSQNWHWAQFLHNLELLSECNCNTPLCDYMFNNLGMDPKNPTSQILNCSAALARLPRTSDRCRVRVVQSRMPCLGPVAADEIGMDQRIGGGGGAKTVKQPRQQPAHPQYANYWAPLTCKRHTMPHSAPPQHTNYWAPQRGNDTSRSTGRSGRQNAATRCSMRREERVTLQGPVKEQQPDGMSRRGHVRAVEVLFGPKASLQNDTAAPFPRALGSPVCRL